MAGDSRVSPVEGESEDADLLASDGGEETLDDPVGKMTWKKASFIQSKD